MCAVIKKKNRVEFQVRGSDCIIKQSGWGNFYLWMTFEQKPEENRSDSQVRVWRQDSLGREKYKKTVAGYLCKKTMAGISLVTLRNTKEVSTTGTESGKTF